MNLVGQNTAATGSISRRALVRGLLVIAAIGLLFITAVLAGTSITASPSAGVSVEKASPAGHLLDPLVIEHLRREHASGGAASVTDSQFDRALAEHRQREYASGNRASSNASPSGMLLDPAVVEHFQREHAS